VDISIPVATGQPHIHTLGPSNSNGISSQVVKIGGGDAANGGTVIKTTGVNKLLSE